MVKQIPMVEQTSMVEKRACFSRWRLRLTGIGGVALFGVSAFCNLSPWPLWVFVLGITCALSGLLLRIWATGWLVKNETLTTDGPYRLTRNPLYLGTLLLVLGQCLMSDIPWAPLLFPALCLALYWPTIRQEEEYLGQCYGADYTAYANQVPLLLPNGRIKAKSPSPASKQTFEWRRVRRCYKGFLANALVILIYAVLHLAR
jgi:protein-S-isoprenylcysteine O-methyltransferase Ste14